MGLDSVEIVMEVEDEFAISIPDDEAEKIRRVGELIEAVKRRVSLLTRRPCPTAKTFYGLRRALMHRIGVDRRDIRLATPLAAILPFEHRREMWDALRGAGFKLPGLRRPTLAWSAGLVVTIIVLLSWLGLTQYGAPLPIWWSLVILLAGASLAYWITSPLARLTPATCMTVRDAVLRNTNPETGEDGETQWTRELVSYKVRQIIADTMGHPLDFVTEDKHFTEDLHMD